MIPFTCAYLRPLIASLAFALTTPAFAETEIPTYRDPGIERAVLAANAAMVDAANRLDLDAFFAAIVDTDRGMIVQNGTIFRTRAEARAAVERGLQGVTRLERRFDDPQVTVISAETALLVSTGSVTATLDDGRLIDGRFTVSLVFVLRDGRWQLLHGHYSVPPVSM